MSFRWLWSNFFSLLLFVPLLLQKHVSRIKFESYLFKPLALSHDSNKQRAPIASPPCQNHHKEQGQQQKTQDISSAKSLYAIRSYEDSPPRWSPPHRPSAPHPNLSCLIWRYVVMICQPVAPVLGGFTATFVDMVSREMMNISTRSHNTFPPTDLHSISYPSFHFDIVAAGILNGNSQVCHDLWLCNVLYCNVIHSVLFLISLTTVKRQNKWFPHQEPLLFLAVLSAMPSTRAIVAGLEFPARHGDWTPSQATGRRWGSSASNPVSHVDTVLKFYSLTVSVIVYFISLVMCCYVHRLNIPSLFPFAVAKMKVFIIPVKKGTLADGWWVWSR